MNNDVYPHTTFPTWTEVPPQHHYVTLKTLLANQKGGYKWGLRNSDL